MPRQSEANGPRAGVDRFVAATAAPDEATADRSTGRAVWEAIRPRTFSTYPGQDKAKENLEVFVQAALLRGQVLDHVLLHGPPGLGKTTLAHIVAEAMGRGFYPSSAPAIDRPADLAGMLANLESGAVFFVDEIHRLSLPCEEILYGAMEDFSIDLVVGQGPAARSVKIELEPFTLIGATTKVSLLSRPFLSRFGIQERLVYYPAETLALILARSAEILNLDLVASAALELGRRSRGTPRIANRLLRRVADFALTRGQDQIDSEVVAHALSKLDIDSLGLDSLDRAILATIEREYAGGPVGIEALAVALGEERATLEEVYEPFLVYMGLISRGPRGRVLTPAGRRHVCPDSLGG